PPASALMVMRFINGAETDYRWRSADQISNNLVHAVVVSEDARICEHDGVDWDVLKGLVAIDEEGQPVRGGSTIAMQTAKNLFLWPDRSYVRKGLEIPISLWIDYTWPKRRIVEIYLNIAEWGPGIYGAEAASRRFFKKPAARLSAQQAALLAAALPNPMIYTAGKPGPKLRRRAKRVRTRMRGAGPYVKCLE
ncbi:MAG: monofunctional biosynthetic peptidoglycan transglycosylase, partial [Aestuariivirgaceae bacterium]